MAALSSGELDASTAEAYRTQLQELLTVVSAADQYLGIGNDISAGIASGMAQYGFESDATTLAGNIETAIRSAVQSHSPSDMTKPIGGDLSEGIGVGMTDFDFSASAAAVSGSLLSALKTNMKGADIVGLNFAEGLAGGILSGRSAVISASISIARAAASSMKQELQISSPSKLTPGFGEYFGEGFIGGIEGMNPEIYRAISDALYIEPPSGIPAGRAYGAEMGGASGSAIDMEKLADVIAQRPVVLDVNGKKFAESTVADNARAGNSRNNSIARGYGIRGR